MIQLFKQYFSIRLNISLFLLKTLFVFYNQQVLNVALF